MGDFRWHYAWEVLSGIMCARCGVQSSVREFGLNHARGILAGITCAGDFWLESCMGDFGWNHWWGICVGIT